MRDDTRGEEANFSCCDFSLKVNAILEHRSQRKLAARWARNLRFLTFDDVNINSGTENLEDYHTTQELRHGQCSRCELRVPPPAGHICAIHSQIRKPSIKANETRLKEYADPCVHVEDATCADCRNIPLFPNHGRITRFRIRRLKPKDTKPSGLSSCTHFVAVSYCGSSQKAAASKTDDKQYQVLEEDLKTVRPIRASKDTIDRAVSFAAENGIRMIWIDQECIEQDKEEEKELGIQAMDYVYVRAHISIGLFQATLEQRHLDALLLFFEMIVKENIPRRGPKPFRQRQSLRFKTLAEALSMVVKDGWNTRAWILQEAFVSGGNMILLFPRAKNVNVKGWSLICHEMSLSEIGIKLDLLQQCIKQSMAFSVSMAHDRISIKLPEWEETLDRLLWFQPDDKPSQSFNFWLNDFKPRRTCNAAVAVSYLKHRDNDRVADRLAIIANLCDYNLRLNTVKLEMLESRLSVCILALALMNGDLSLLPPEFYHVPRGLYVTHSRGDQDFTWIPSSTKQFKYIEANSFNPGGPTIGRDTPLSYRLSNKGLSLLGFMWKIDYFVSLAPIRDKYADSWSRLWRSSAKGEEPSSEATGKGHGHPKKRMMSRNHGLAITQILFEILMLLRAEDQIATADAIWHSVLNAHWNKFSRGQEGDVLESVVEFPDHLRIERRQGMFQLDQGLDETFHHKWLIDRIMLQGGLWLGHLVQYSTDKEYTDRILARSKRSEGIEPGLVTCEDPVDHATQDHSREQTSASTAQPPFEEMADTAEDALASEADDITKLSDQPSTPKSVEPSPIAGEPHSHGKDFTPQESHHKLDQVKTPWRSESHFNNQFTCSMLMKFSNFLTTTTDDTEDDKNDRTDLQGSLMTSPDAMVGLAAMIDHMEGRNSVASLRQQRAIFDLEGDTSGRVLVLTPFQQHMETLPRPEIRSMSVSWVVQPALQPRESQDGEESEPCDGEALRTTGMVRGMWKFMVQPESRYNLI